MGATTIESLTRLLLKVAPVEPDLLIVYHGFNDLLPRMFDGFSDDYYHFRQFPTRDHHLLERLYLYRLFETGLISRGRPSDNRNLPHHTWKYANLPDTNERRIANFRKTDAAVFKRNMEYMIQLALARNISVVLSTFAFNDNEWNWAQDFPDELWEEGIQQNNDAIRQLAATYDLPLIEFFDYGVAHEEIFRDSIHMEDEGNKNKASFFMETVVPVVEAELQARPEPELVTA